MLNDKTTHGLWLAAITASTLLWGGCRSVPGLNRFVRSSEPSADVLAGTGPSATYPAPPSASATPQAIASVAGGTSGSASANVASSTPAPPTTSQVAGINVSPGYATPATNNSATNNQSPSYTASQSGYTAPQPNYAAANANGVYANNAGTTGNPSKPSPYTFGTKTFTPNSAPETSPVLPKASYSNPTGSPYAKSAYGMPATTAPSSGGPSASAPTATASFTPPDMATTNAKDSGSMSGFTLPTNIPSTASASLTPPSASTAGKNASGNSFGLPSNTAGQATNQAAAGPAFSTASADADSMGHAPSSYMPGSTGKTQGYPGNRSKSPATSGSFYR
jgi:hypothetical protein